MNNDPGGENPSTPLDAPQPADDWMAEDHPVVVHLAFAFDIGDEIDLDQARELLQGVLGKLPPTQADP